VDQGVALPLRPEEIRHLPHPIYRPIDGASPTPTNPLDVKPHHRLTWQHPANLVRPVDLSDLLTFLHRLYLRQHLNLNHPLKLRPALVPTKHGPYLLLAPLARLSVSIKFLRVTRSS
jgi:hypothetical protein